jgi:multidrug efflux pump subunit AcrB
MGGMLAAFAIGNSLSFASLVGLLAVLGITARHSIMLISRYQHLERHEHEPPGPDLVLRGTREHIASILITTLAVGLALTPLVILGDLPGQEIARPMAIVILGGLVTSTLFNILLLPTLYLHFGSQTVSSESDTTRREPDAAL